MTTTREESQFETPSELPAEPKKRVVRRRTVQTDAEGVEAAPAKKPRATRTRKAKVEAEPPAAEPVAEVTAQEADKPKRRVVRRRKTEESETPVVVPVEAAEGEQPVAKRRTVTRRKKVEDVTPESMTAATSEEVPAEAELPARPKRTRRTVKADAVTEQESAKKPRTRKIKAEPEAVEASE